MAESLTIATDAEERCTEAEHPSVHEPFERALATLRVVKLHPQRGEDLLGAHENSGLEDAAVFEETRLYFVAKPDPVAVVEGGPESD